MSDLLRKGLIAIFFSTFFLVFVILTMVEPYLYCTGDENTIIPECRVMDFSGEFILGVLIGGVLFLLDMGLVYLILAEILI
jgi:hypothetical protein